MARLNDPPVSNETIDSLRRRFVRQNREIARVNSTQSVRIRTLEAEISRLLSENIAFREQIIRLEQENDQEHRRNLREDVRSIQNKLEDKLAELGGIVSELDRARDVAQQAPSPFRKQNKRRSLKKSPDQRNWKNNLTLSEATRGHDGRLPPILEDKCYPRKTLDANELLSLLSDPANTTDSPDLGPPPIAHFEQGDPIKYDETQRALARDASRELSDDPSSTLSTKIESRRRRRESFHAKDIVERKHERPLASSSGQDLHESAGFLEGLSSQPLKSGAKRKFGAREADEQQLHPKSSNDGFLHNQRSSASGASLEDVSSLNIPTDEGSVSRKVPETAAISKTLAKRERSRKAELQPASSPRKALEPKSANADPTRSPIRSSKAVVDEKAQYSLKKLSKKYSDTVDVGISQPSAKSDPPLKQDRRPLPRSSTESFIEPTDLQPKTPLLPANLFSPLSENSAPRPESNDTPPPPDLGSSLSQPGGGRTARRPRNPVSYAEPNLRDKMRRPTKELVDAVAADERMRRAAIVKDEEEEDVAVVGTAPSAAAGKKMMTVLIKSEDVGGIDSDAWKSLPIAKDDNGSQLKGDIGSASALGAKTTTAAGEGDCLASAITERKRRGSVSYRSDGQVASVDSESQSAPRATIAALAAIGGSRQRHRESTSVGKEQDETKKAGDEAKENGDMFEFSASSPPVSYDEDGDHNAAAKRTTRKDASASTQKTSRRYSSVPDSLRGVAELGVRGEDGRTGKSGTRERRAGWRRDGLSIDATGARRTTQEDRRAKDAESASGEAKTSGRASVEPTKADSLTRAERAASRRRSMMV